ncbi:cyclic pyranopterin monophosphate synthase MoaC [Alienimonas chondri]|uniref:Cyclic pyranopterin monophosphate synthase n=1 Tax=Alienimonas chondri TaxID=2681879 RepID=A0ABX1VBB1_9PLAN|nr:cyclic pyranopterin monophosphate synthase MoaC [Alienimonas chondri]NNJ25389.1 Cyclic pyranopterin monophosphate synthase [Alienimonas chondri]
MSQSLTHFDETGAARMVDVAAKPVTQRTAVAEATVRCEPATLDLILSGDGKKGDVRQVARIAGIQAAKNTGQLIPLCHPLPLDGVTVDFASQPPGRLTVTASVTCTGRTGVEMEALCAASVAALTVYDMVKAVDRGMTVETVRLLSKTGGRSGDWQAGQTTPAD